MTKLFPGRFHSTLLGLFLAILPMPAWADATTAIAAGRQALRDKNLAQALTQFTAAHSADPANQEADVLLAAVQFANLSNKKEAQALLTRLGVPMKGRDLFKWKAKPKKAAALALATDDYKTAIKTVILPSLDGIQALLAGVTSPGFQIPLSQAESGLPDVIIDFGDVKMIRSIVQELQSEILLLDAYETNLKIPDFLAWRKTNLLTVQKILSVYPKLLNLRNAANVVPGLTAFSAAVTTYGQAVDFIKLRADNTSRVFVLEPDSVADEAKFSAELRSVQSSISATTVFDSRTSLNVGAYSSSPVSLRGLLPAFQANHPAPAPIGNFPDLTFHAVLPGMTKDRVDHFFARLGELLDRRFHYRADPLAPKLLVTAPKANAHVYVAAAGQDGSVTFAGKATDNKAVDRVEIEVDGGTYVATGTSNWSLPIMLSPRVEPYSATVRAFDAQGNASTPVDVHFSVILRLPIELTIGAGGSVSPTPKSNQVFEAFHNYPFTATPKPGFLFDHWTVTNGFGTYDQSNSSLSVFNLASATKLTASFALNPYLHHAGTFSGLLNVTSAQGLPSSGLFNVTVSKTGALTGKVFFLGRTESLSGQLTAAGFAEIKIKHPPHGSLTANAFFNFGDPTISSPDGVSLSLNANGAFAYGFGNKGDFPGLAGKYTLVLPPRPDVLAEVPRGYGYATLTNDGQGNIRTVGTLANGAPFMSGARVSGDGEYPIFARLDASGSELAGSLTVDASRPGAELSGRLHWTHWANPIAPTFKAAFGLDLQSFGGRYVAPTKSNLVPPFTPGGSNVRFTPLFFTPAAVSIDVGSSPLTLAAGNVVAAVADPKFKLKLTLTASSGLFKGSFQAGTPATVHTFSGIILQSDSGYGFFQDPTADGGIRLTKQN